jgi:PHD/YefM family antitoxin component YafN of YafNO toxin-antitoxin module
MSEKARKRSPEIIVKDGRPRAVILDIDEYQEDIEDIKMLPEMRKKPLKFRKLEKFLEEYKPGV